MLLPPWIASKETNMPYINSGIKQLSSNNKPSPHSLVTTDLVGGLTDVNTKAKTQSTQEKADVTQMSTSVPGTFESVQLDVETFKAETRTTVITKEQDRADSNQKPKVNLTVQQSIQHEINQWSFTENSPINYSVNIIGLFEDPDDDLLTTQIAVNHPKFSVSNIGGKTSIQGTPKVGVAPTQLIARAKDNYHGSEENAWVTTSFSLPSMSSGLEENGLHPLIGETWYRLETNHRFAGKTYNYEKVYCEAFKFINDEVFFASSNTLTTCPNEYELRKVGSYQVDGDTLIVSSTQSIFDNDMHWKILETYPSNPTFTTAHVAQVKMNNNYETYTLASKAQIEQRINTITGLEALQMTMQNYMYLANDGRYYLGWYGMHIGNYQLKNPDWPDEMDGDLNIQSYSTTVVCKDVLNKFDFFSIGGQGLYGDVIGYTVSEKNAPIECGVQPIKTLQYSYLDVDFFDHDEFKHGEVFSIILRPKTEWRHKVEEIKLNVRFLGPDG